MRPMTVHCIRLKPATRGDAAVGEPVSTGADEVPAAVEQVEVAAEDAAGVADSTYCVRGSQIACVGAGYQQSQPEEPNYTHEQSPVPTNDPPCTTSIDD
ncbi:unnamed protein product [Echinostoma caproni]|uniref:Uncharacterized protein n=1 Tax=Echinostoma caproni TaxID=27848 RepID=A0A183A4P5_9TREM|nr:unnamed protein product [Echinostoma caproni]